MKRTLKEARDYFNQLMEARNAAKKKAQTDGFDTLSVEERAAITKYDDEHLTVLEEIRALSPDPHVINLHSGIPGNRDISNADLRNFERFRLNRALRSLVENKALVGVEKEVHEIGVKQAEERGGSVSGFALPDMSEYRAGLSATGETANPGDQGGVTIPTVLGGLIEQFWSKSVLSNLGVTRLTGLHGNIDFPVQASKPVVEELTEIQSTTDTEVLFDTIAMTPNRRGITIPYSKQLLLQTSLSVESMLRNLILRAFGLKADAEAITKIINKVGIGAVVGGTNGLAPNWDHIVDLETTIAASDADQGSLAYLTNPKVKGKLKKTQMFSGTNGMPIWEKGTDPLNGYPAVVSNTVPSNLTKGSSSGVCSAIIFANWLDLYVGQWGVIDFIVDPYGSNAKKAQIAITANTFWDIEVARAASFAAMKDALTA